MLMEVKNHIKIVLMSLKYNIMKEMTNKVTFITNVIFMILNNASFLIQWIVLFHLKNNIGGYKLNDIILLWGLASSSYGFAHLLFNRAFNMNDVIVNGKLDSFLVQPKNILISFITSTTAISAIGDILYGYIILIIFKFSIYNLIMFTLFTITSCLIVTSFAIIVGSLSFWFPNSDSISNNLNNMIIHFATYPDGIFKGIVKLLLYTIIPIGLVAYIPIKIIINFNLLNLSIILLSTIFIIFLAYKVFFYGLKRYSSSNLMISKI